MREHEQHEAPPSVNVRAVLWVGRALTVALLAGVGTVSYLVDPKLVFCTVPFVACYYGLARGRAFGALALLAVSSGIGTAAALGVLPMYTLMLSGAGALTFGVTAPSLWRFDAPATLLGIALAALLGSGAVGAGVALLG